MKVKIINVFSINNQGGNPCAIVDNAAHLSTDEMQAMATHFNLPETVFIIPDKKQYLLWFFATKGELPLCCHGALGAAYYLFKSEYGKSLNIKSYQTKTNLDISCDDNLIAMSIVNNGKIIDDNIDLDFINKLLAIDKTSINAHLPCAIASIGSPKLLVPVIALSMGFMYIQMIPNNLILTMSVVTLIHCSAIKRILRPVLRLPL